MPLRDKIKAQVEHEKAMKDAAAIVIGNAFRVAPEKISFEQLPSSQDIAVASGFYASGFRGAEPLEQLLTEGLGIKATPLFTPQGLVGGVAFPDRTVIQAAEALQEITPEEIAALAAKIQQAKELSGSRSPTR